MNIQTLVKNQTKNNVPDVRPGQVVRVHERIKEGDKERIQVFEGLVISVKHGKGLNGMFAVRKMARGNVGVERTFPLHLPAIEKIEVLRREKIRRAKLYYVRDQVNKKTKKRKTILQSFVFEEEEPEDDTIEEEVLEQDNSNPTDSDNTEESKEEVVAPEVAQEENKQEVPTDPEGDK